MASDLLDTVMDGFGAEAIALLKSQSTPCRFRRGTTLYRQSEPADGIFVIESGSIIVERMSPAGNITSYRIALRGTISGTARISRASAARPHHAASPTRARSGFPLPHFLRQS